MVRCLVWTGEDWVYCYNDTVIFTTYLMIKKELQFKLIKKSMNPLKFKSVCSKSEHKTILK